MYYNLAHQYEAAKLKPDQYDLACGSLAIILDNGDTFDPWDSKAQTLLDQQVSMGMISAEDKKALEALATESIVLWATLVNEEPSDQQLELARSM